MKMFQKAASAVTAIMVTMSMAASSSSALLMNATAADKTAIDIVNEMGLGWNLGNTFDCVGASETYFGIVWETDGATGWIYASDWDANSTETAWGNPVTTKAMIDAIHAEGFDSIRIPVTWFENADPTTHDIDDAYLARVKEVVDYAYDNGMYVILNMHWDSSGGSDSRYWLDAGESALPQYETMWTEIANYFKDYDNHLVLESMNEVPFDYATLNTFNQTFVDIVRGTGGNNADRLLLLAGANDDLSNTCSSEYILPDDDMIAVSVHYYYPSTWAVATESSTWGHQETWGTDSDKQAVYDNFAKMKSYYVDQGVPVIVGEYGVNTSEDGGKDKDDIVEYLDTVASSALATDGVAAFVWDSGSSGDMQYFDRTNLTWFDSAVGDLYNSLKTNGASVSFSYDTTTTTSNQATIELSGDFDYTIDLSPYDGKGVTITQVILNGTPGVGCGVSFNANNPDGSARNWTAEGGEVGDDGVGTVEIDGIYDGEDGEEEYILTMTSMTISRWWGTSPATLDSITLVFDKEITFSTTTVTVTENNGSGDTTEPTEDTTEPTEDTTEPQGADTSDGYRAYLSYVNSGWWIKGNFDEETDNLTSVETNVTGDGTYTVQLVNADGLKESDDTDITGTAFMALYIADAQADNPNMVITIDSIKADDTEIALTAKNFTCSEDGEVRTNIYNTWSSVTADDIYSRSSEGVFYDDDGNLLLDISDYSTVIIEKADIDWANTLEVTFTVSGMGASDSTDPTDSTEPTTEPTDSTNPTDASDTPSTNIKKGDANEDGNVTIMDVILINKTILGKDTLSEQGLANIDFNGNDMPDAEDSLSIMKLIVGLITEDEL